MSMVLRPAVPIHFAPQLTLLTAVALCRSLKRVTSLPIGIKWPNDLLIEGKKISGILLESAAEDERLRYVIAGIGISVNLEQSDYPAELLEKAVSLQMAAGQRWDRSELIAAFLQDWEQLYRLYEEEGFGPIIVLWEALAVSLGKPVRLATPQGELQGIPVGLAESGAIRIKLEDGTIQSVFSAEMGEPL
jgi:BirA family biotin operon repressor/biotin-[acetyl-CoA-carboxylase] ligase